MPEFDRTGPTGAGPRTGRGLGMCGRLQGDPITGSPGSGRGGGRGLLVQGRGRRGYFAGVGRWWTRLFRPAVSLGVPGKTHALRSDMSFVREAITALKLRLEKRDTKS